MNTQFAVSDWVGRVVDTRFILRRWLGGNAECSVYVADYYVDQSRRVAVKILAADAPDADSRFENWSRAAALSHPNLMPVLHVGRSHIDDAEIVYIATEYAGEVLAEILSERALTKQEAIQMAGPVLDALEVLHQQGFVHGHLTPSNILVVNDQLKLSVDSVLPANVPVRNGRPLDEYDAPECDTRIFSPAADVWSYGITLVESLTQHVPAWMRSSHAEPALPRSLNRPFAQIARECLRRDTTLRCSIGEIRQSLTSDAPIPHRARPLASYPAGKGRFLWLGIAAAVILSSAAFLFSARSDSRPPQKNVAVPPKAAAPPAAIAVTAQPPAVAQAAPEGSQAARSPLPVPAAVVNPAPAPSPSKPAAPLPDASTPHSAGAKGALLQQVMPDIPAKAMRTISGTVRFSLRLHVDPQGKVNDAAIDNAGSSPYFVKLALKSVDSWRFNPPVANGQPAPSVWSLQYAITQAGTEVTPTQETP